MIKLIITFIFAMLFTIFASQNMESVRVHFIFGPPIEVPKIVLVFSSFMLGVIVTLFFTIASRTKKPKVGDAEEEHEED